MTTPRIYYAVPTHYTIGDEYPTFEEAVAAARATIKPFDGIPGFSRAFVDIRREDEQGDRPLDRIEIFHDSPDPATGEKLDKEGKDA